MKILHTSDWHLGMSFGIHSLADEQRSFIGQLVQIIEDKQVDAVIIAGDIYDTSVSNREAIELYNMAVTGICNERNVPLLVIAGNHDGAARLASCRELLERAGLFVVGRLEADIQPVTIQDVDFYLLPYFNMDEVKSLYPDEAKTITSYESATDVVCNHIRETLDRSKKNIVISHSFIVGSELSDSDRSAKVGTATAVSKDVFREFDYVALGHIHRPQNLTDRIRYSGSPLIYSFGAEEKYEKSVTILDTDTMEQEYVPIRPIRNVRTLEGTYEQIMDQPASEDFLRLVITDHFVGLETISLLRERFPYAVEIRGKSFDIEQGEEHIRVEDISELSEEDIVKSFFKEIYQYEPTESQMKLFASAKSAKEAREGRE